MAIQITAQGSRAGVLAHIAEVKAEPGSPEETQIEAFKAFLVCEVKALPEEFNGCNVNCQGQVSGGLRHATINVIPMRLHL